MTADTAAAGEAFHPDPAFLDLLAETVAAPDGSAWYFTRRRIEEVFRRAGWEWAREDPFETSRYVRTRKLLHDRRATPELVVALLARLVNPLEHHEAPQGRDALLSALDELLGHQGYALEDAPGGALVVPAQAARSRITGTQRLALTADLSAVVEDAAYGRVLADRVDEAGRCWEAGARLATVILMGSVLEGVLVTVSAAHGSVRRTRRGRPDFAELVGNARERGWVAKDVLDHVDVLREHRNLVHPRKQVEEGYPVPGDDAVRIAWNVVTAVLNDLGRLPWAAEGEGRRETAP